MSKVCKHRRAWPTVWSHPSDHGFYWCPCCGAVRLMHRDGWLRPVGFHLLAGREMPLDARPDLDDMNRIEEAHS